MRSNSRTHLQTLLCMSALIFATASSAQPVPTVTIHKAVKKTIGVVTALNAGDVACYVDLKDDQGLAFKEIAEFELCEQKPSLVGKRVQLQYQLTSVQSDACQGNPDCKKTRQVVVIAKANILESRISNSNISPQAKPSSAAQTKGKQSSFCTPTEQVVFACRTGEKMVSVCASKNANRNKGYLQYRFGEPDSTAPLEMMLPEDQVIPGKSANGDMVPYAGGGASWLRFNKGQYSYVVYTGIGRWGPKGETREKQGLLVERSGKRIANLKCSHVPISELGPDLFEKLGIQSNNQEFDMPD